MFPSCSDCFRNEKKYRILIPCSAKALSALHCLPGREEEKNLGHHWNPF